MSKQTDDDIPQHLGEHGRALYRAIRDDYAVDDSAGLALLTTAAECLDRVRAAQAKIAEHGEVVLDRYGSLKANPAVQIEKDSRNGFLASLKALNLDIEPLKDKPGRPPEPTGWTGPRAVSGGKD